MSYIYDKNPIADPLFEINRTTKEQLIIIKDNVNKLVSFPHDGWHIPEPLAIKFNELIDVLISKSGMLPKPYLFPQGPDTCSLTWKTNSKSLMFSLFVDPDGEEPDSMFLLIIDYEPITGIVHNQQTVDLSARFWDKQLINLVLKHIH